MDEEGEGFSEELRILCEISKMPKSQAGQSVKLDLETVRSSLCRLSLALMTSFDSTTRKSTSPGT